MVRADAPLRIRSVRIEGNKRTDAAVFEDELQEAYRATTVEGVHRNLLRAAHRLEGLGIFDGVTINMAETPTKAKGETDVTISVSEKGYVTAYTGTSVTRDDVAWDLSASLRNPTGQAEVLSGTFSQSRLGSKSMRATILKPRVFSGRPVSFRVEGHLDTLNFERTSSLRTKVQALALHLQTHDARHRLSYEWALRDVLPRRHLTVPYAYDASLSIMREAHPSYKSAVRYKFVDDRRDHPLLPTQGTYFSALGEVAGLLLGDTAYVKAEVASSAHTRLLGFLTAHVGGSFGVVKPMAWRQQADDGAYAAEPTTRFPDRYMLGGLQSLRGFGHTGAGPRASPKEGGCTKGDALGGDIRCTATAALAAPLPIPVLDALGLRAHVFADAGNLLPWSAPLPSLLTDMRVSVGAGLAFALGVARVELNYAVPLRRVIGRDVEQRWQLGLGATIYS